MPQITVLNGPNLNLLGLREPAIYGSGTLADIGAMLDDWAKDAGHRIVMRQSNHEGMLIDWLHEARGAAAGVIINPGGLTHSSVALGDAVAAIGIPVIEVHISNIHAREPFRSRSYIAPHARGTIAGLGISGYLLAARALAKIIADNQEG